MLAGLLLGCLTLKPQLGLLIPVALLAAAAWRTILAAALTAALLAALPTLLLGLEYWEALRGNVVMLRDAVVADVHREGLMVGPLSLLTSLGMPVERALAAQWAMTATTAVAVFIAWRSKRASFDLKAAVLLLAMSISSPYLWYYEMTLLAAAALFLLRSGAVALDQAGALLFVALWLGTGPLVVARLIGVEADHVLGAPLVTAVVFIGLGLCVWRLSAAPPARTLPPSGS